mmetsp:Transcript_42505/g.83560  ORF Transcript_42505/g.83560 Transcript_42505/m.83560 type:complete len:409 (-) Transcript_42505:434-1660(-)
MVIITGARFPMWVTAALFFLFLAVLKFHTVEELFKSSELGAVGHDHFRTEDNANWESGDKDPDERTEEAATTEEFVRTLLASYDATGSVSPIWECADSFRESGWKLGFVHVFKTAGSAVGGFLNDYAEKCSGGYVRIVRCTKVDPGSVRSGDGDWNHCVLKKGISRVGINMESDYTRKVQSHFLADQIDIIGGHYKLGTMDELKSRGGKHKIRYLTFFRDAAMRYVSAVSYIKGKKGFTMSEIVEEVKNNVLSTEKYDVRYADYLLTLWQVEKKIAGRRLSEPQSAKNAEKFARLVMKNLVDFNVIIGITEKWSFSLEILQFVMDANSDAKDVFIKHGMVDQHGKTSSELSNNNRSSISTFAIIVEIKKDIKAYNALIEHVKYEQMIYDFAVALQNKQYETVQKWRLL